MKTYYKTSPEDLVNSDQILVFNISNPNSLTGSNFETYSIDPTKSQLCNRLVNSNSYKILTDDFYFNSFIFIKNNEKVGFAVLDSSFDLSVISSLILEIRVNIKLNLINVSLVSELTEHIKNYLATHTGILTTVISKLTYNLKTPQYISPEPFTFSDLETLVNQKIDNNLTTGFIFGDKLIYKGTELVNNYPTIPLESFTEFYKFFMIGIQLYLCEWNSESYQVSKYYSVANTLGGIVKEKVYPASGVGSAFINIQEVSPTKLITDSIIYDLASDYSTPRSSKSSIINYSCLDNILDIKRSIYHYDKSTPTIYSGLLTTELREIYENSLSEKLINDPNFSIIKELLDVQGSIMIYLGLDDNYYAVNQYNYSKIGSDYVIINDTVILSTISGDRIVTYLDDNYPLGATQVEILTSDNIKNSVLSRLFNKLNFKVQPIISAYKGLLFYRTNAILVADPDLSKPSHLLGGNLNPL